MRISDWSSDVCSSDLATAFALRSLDLVEARPLLVVVNGEHGLAGADVADHEARCPHAARYRGAEPGDKIVQRGLEVVCHLHGLLDLDPATLVEDLGDPRRVEAHVLGEAPLGLRSEEHTSELQSLMRISYAVFCL